MKAKEEGLQVDYIGSQDAKHQPTTDDFAAISQYIKERKQLRSLEKIPPTPFVERSSRAFVLDKSLLIEHLASAFIATLLGIELRASAALGSTSKAISFADKLNLLMDLRLAGKERKTKLASFLEIRNQFMHNGSVSSFTECFNVVKGKDRWMLANYPQNDLASVEEQLRGSFNQLSEDVIAIIGVMFIESEKERLLGGENHIIFHNKPNRATVNDAGRMFSDLFYDLKKREEADASKLSGEKNNFVLLFSQMFSEHLKKEGKKESLSDKKALKK